MIFPAMLLPIATFGWCFVISLFLCLFVMKRLARRAVIYSGSGFATKNTFLSEDSPIGVRTRWRSVGLYFLLPVAMLGLLMGFNLSSGVAWSSVIVPVAAICGMAAGSLIVALVLLGVLPQRAGVVLADRVRLSVPGMFGAGEKIYPWATAELASIDVVGDLSVVVVRVDGVSSCLLVDRESLEVMRGLKAGTEGCETQGEGIGS